MPYASTDLVKRGIHIKTDGIFVVLELQFFLNYCPHRKSTCFILKQYPIFLKIQDFTLGNFERIKVSNLQFPFQYNKVLIRNVFEENRNQFLKRQDS